MRPALYLLVLTLVTAGCSESQTSGHLSGGHVAPELPKNVILKLKPGDLPFDTRELRFGVTPYLGTEHTRRGFQPIATYLSRVLEVPVRLVIVDSYKKLIEKVVAKEVDIASLSPISYVLAKERLPNLQILAQELARGATSFSSYVIVRSEDKIQSIDKLKGKRIAFVALSSSSGFVIPYAWLLGNGLDPEKDFVPCFSGNHPKSIKALVDGRVDIAFTGSGMLRSAATGPAGKAQFDPQAVRIIAKAGRIPFDPVCARGDIPKTGIQKIAHAFMALTTRTNKGRRILANTAGINGWMPARNSQYDSIRRILAQVRHHRRQSSGSKPIPQCDDE